jgi:hypothetical protein
MDYKKYTTYIHKLALDLLALVFFLIYLIPLSPKDILLIIPLSPKDILLIKPLSPKDILLIMQDFRFTEIVIGNILLNCPP